MSESIKLQNDIYIDNTGVHKDIAIGYYNNNFTLVHGNKNALFENAVIIGKKLKLVNGNIIVGKGVKRVRVNATGFFENVPSSTTRYIWLFIYQSGRGIANAITSGTSDYYDSVCVTDTILDVSEGDVLGLVFNWSWRYENASAPIVRSGIATTRLYVEVIE